MSRPTTQANQVAMAEACTNVRASIGRMLLSPEDSPERSAAADAYRRHLRSLLRLAREEEFGIYMEVAGDLATRE